MADSPSGGFDPLGTGALGRAVEKATEGAIAGLGRTFQLMVEPWASEVGQGLADSARVWRQARLAKLEEKVARKQKGTTIGKGQYVNPKVALAILDTGSREDQDDIQEMWAGLLISSLSEGGKDDGHLIYVDLLARMTSAGARILDFVCRSAVVRWGTVEGPTVSSLTFHDTADYRTELLQVTRLDNPLRLDREVAHFKRLGLLDDVGRLTFQPSQLGLELYARVQGYAGDPGEFYRQRSKPQ